MKENKRAQYYPAFVIIFTLAILVIAFFAIVLARDHASIKGETHSFIFRTLQRSHNTQQYLDQTAKIVSTNSLKQIQNSCQSSLSSSYCGRYVYNLWSDKEKLCLPDCSETFVKTFNQSFNQRISDLNSLHYYNGSFPKNYSYSFTRENDLYVLRGFADKQFTEYITPTGNFIAPTKQDKEPSLISYSYKPAFTLKINNSFNVPLETVFSWLEKTWNECQGNNAPLRNCIEENLEEFNEDENQDKKDVFYKLGFSEMCEDDTSLFYDFMSQIEDCFSNQQKECACPIDFKEKIDNKDITNIKITLDSGFNRALFYYKEKNSAYMPFSEGGKKISHEFSLGGLEKSTVKEIIFDVKDGKITLNSASSISFEKQTKEQGSIVFDSSMQECLSPFHKTTYNFCAKSNNKQKNILEQVKFSAQFRDHPPRNTGSKDSDIKINAVANKPCTSSDLEKTLSIGDLSLTSVVSNIPLVGHAITFAQIVNELENKDTSTTLTIETDNKDIAGYEVVCEKQGILKNVIPENYFSSKETKAFVLIDDVFKNKESQLFVQGETCTFPVPNKDGVLKEVRAIRPVGSGGKTVVNIDSCNGENIVMDKLISQNYCFSVVPVDKNGNRGVGEIKNTCIEVNSVKDIVISELIKRGFGKFLTIPDGLIPKELQPYINLPCPEDILKADFDYNKIIDMEKIENSFGFDKIILKQINDNILSRSFSEAFKELNIWERQNLVTSMIKYIKNENYKKLFLKALGEEFEKESLPILTDYLTSQKTEEVIDDLIEKPDNKLVKQKIKSFSVERFSQQQKEEIIRIALESDDFQTKKALIDKAQREKPDCIGLETTVYTRANANKALDCLSSDQKAEVYNSLDSDEIVKRSKEKLSSEEKKEVLKIISSNKDISPSSKKIIKDRLKELDASAKKDFVTKTLKGEIMPEVTKEIQEEMMVDLTTEETEIITKILKEQNVAKVFESKLRSSIKDTVSSFIGNTCTPTS
jgi:tRNA threonylcarbamoyladenosine modification (KEOPS) complex Cgi121 subunit